jgi:hypothetical protein
VLSQDDISENDARDTVMLLGLLSNYNKYEFKNPYLLHLGKTKQEKALETIIDMYTTTFKQLTRYIFIYSPCTTAAAAAITTIITMLTLQKKADILN